LIVHLALKAGFDIVSNQNGAARHTFERLRLFQLRRQENEALISQFAISKGRGGHRKLPYVFTEQGVAMLSSVLNSERAILVNIAIIRAFVKLRALLATNKDLAKRLDELEKKYDAQFRGVFEAIRQLMAPPEKPRKEIGFKVGEPKARYKATAKR
jgi:hypothetical protein